MKFLFERFEHRLYLMIVLKHCVCLGILEPHIPVSLEQVDEKQSYNALALPFRPDADKKQIQSIRLLQEHRLEQMPPSERKYFTIALLKGAG